MSAKAETEEALARPTTLAQPIRASPANIRRHSRTGSRPGLESEAWGNGGAFGDTRGSKLSGGDKEGEEEGTNRKGKKDVSHVPCKFFKMGQCTAGAACPFSHNLPEPGQSKSVCAWFVKGNCRFAGKCALAHVLPGQPMSMDRKNKRMAQAQAQGKNGGDSSSASKGRSSGQSQQHRGERHSGASATADRSGERTAGAMSELDFTFGLPDDIMSTSPRASATEKGREAGRSGKDVIDLTGSASATSRLANANPDAMPSTAPRRPVRSGFDHFPSPPSTTTSEFTHVQPRSDNVTSGNKTPLSRPSSVTVASSGLSLGFRSGTSVNPVPTGGPSPAVSKFGLEPGTPTSPAPAVFGTSPFSAPGSRSLFLSYSQGSDSTMPPQDTSAVRSLSRVEEASARARWWESLGGPASVGALPSDWVKDAGTNGRRDEEEEEIFEEDFLPSSLHELLTPAELERRRSRHDFTSTFETQSGPAAPTKSGFSSTLWDVEKTSQQNGVTRKILASDVSATSPSNGPLSTSAVTSLPHLFPYHSGNTGSHSAANEGLPMGVGGPIRTDAALSSTMKTPASAHRISTGETVGYLASDLSSLSPGTKALRSHAPGQSLPQGLAAGLSRLHLVPAGLQQTSMTPPHPEQQHLYHAPGSYLDDFGSSVPHRPSPLSQSRGPNDEFGNGVASSSPDSLTTAHRLSMGRRTSGSASLTSLGQNGIAIPSAPALGSSVHARPMSASHNRAATAVRPRHLNGHPGTPSSPLARPVVSGVVEDEIDEVFGME